MALRSPAEMLSSRLVACVNEVVLCAELRNAQAMDTRNPDDTLTAELPQFLRESMKPVTNVRCEPVE